jgi:hypothetical protein
VRSSRLLLIGSSFGWGRNLKFNSIGLDSDGNPVPADLHLAWAAGARAFRLTPR